MRKFCSYGPINTRLHYYVPRTDLIEQALAQLVGEDAREGGHYVTVWAPRQAGKTWVMQQVLRRLRDDERFDVLKLNLEYLKMTDDIDRVASKIAREVGEGLGVDVPDVVHLDDLGDVFRRDVLPRPLILIMDEFDSLRPEAIDGLAGVFRNIYIERHDQDDRPTWDKDYLLHGVALVGVRAVLGVESASGSPFNVQRSIHVPNLTRDEVYEMYRWYERESGQDIVDEVIERVYRETRGQPGLVSWLGELLTEEFNHDPSRPIGVEQFEEAYSAAIHVLPNNNILNVISKARQEPYRQTVLELFRTTSRMPFHYDDPVLNFLYLNGVIDWEKDTGGYTVRFASPLVQKRLFNYFANEIMAHAGRLYDPFEDLGDTITDSELNVVNLLRRYERYLQENREWLLRDAPRRRTDLRPYEAVYHFSLYTYIYRFLEHRGGTVWPEFPTGNGKVDLLIRYAGRLYGLEVKSYVDAYEYRRALKQAARYGRELGLDEIALAFFVESIDEANRLRYEVAHRDPATRVVVNVVFVETCEGGAS